MFLSNYFFANEERKLIKREKDMKLFLLEADEVPEEVDLAMESVYVCKSGKETLSLEYDPYPWWLKTVGTDEEAMAYVDEGGDSMSGRYGFDAPWRRSSGDVD